MSNCIKCDSAVTTHPLVCGHCNKLIHYKCAGIKKTYYDFICANDNVYWFCVGCNSQFRLQINQMSTLTDICKKIENSVKNLERCNNLKSESAHLCDYSNAQNAVNGDVITETFPDSASEPLSECGRSNTNLPINKNETEIDLMFSKQHAMSSTTPDPQKQVNQRFTTGNIHKNDWETRLIPNFNQFIIGTGNDPNLRTVEPRKHVFISRLHPDVCSNDIKQYLSDKIGLNEIRIHRFNPKFNLEDQDYSSFKITVLSADFQKLMSSSLWPAGTLVKEFQNKPRSRSFLGIPQSLTT